MGFDRHAIGNREIGIAADRNRGTANQRRIDVNLISGPFQTLKNRWEFHDDPAGTRIEFDIDFCFKSRILETLLAANFHHAVDKLIGCFEARAKTLYGPQVPPAGAATAGA